LAILFGLEAVDRASANETAREQARERDRPEGAGG